MSFSGGTFSINTAGQPVVNGTSISATVFNAFTADIATGLSTCMLKDGTQTATAGISFYAGTVSLPGIYFGTDTATGFYRIGLNNTGFSINGTKLLDLSAAAASVTGTLGATGAVTGASFAVTKGIMYVPAFDGNAVAIRNSALSDAVGNYALSIDANGACALNAPTGQVVSLAINNSIGARLNASANFLIGTASDGAGTPRLTVAATTQAAVTLTNTANGTGTVNVINADTTGDNIFSAFFTEGTPTVRGTIDYNRAGGQVRYNVTSDMTLKTLIGDAPIETSVGILRAVRLREFFWNDDPLKKPQIAPFAQELYETFKGAVSVGGMQEGGRYKPWGVDKTAFAFHLVAGWQNHDARLAALERKMQ